MILAHATASVTLRHESGDWSEPIFRDKADPRRFVETLDRTCGKTGWQVQTSVLMPNDFTLVPTPLEQLVLRPRFGQQAREM
jgi:hypothetical protein